MNYLQIINNVEDSTEAEEVQTVGESLFTKGLNALRSKFTRLHSGRNERSQYWAERKAKKRGPLGTWAKRYEARLNHADIKDQLDDIAHEPVEEPQPHLISAHVSRNGIYEIRTEEPVEIVLEEEVENKELTQANLHKLSQAYKIDTHSIAYIFGAVEAKEDVEAVCFLAYAYQKTAKLETVIDLYKRIGYNETIDRLEKVEEEAKLKRELSVPPENFAETLRENKNRNLNIPLDIPLYIKEDEANIINYRTNVGEFYGEHEIHEVGMRIVPAEDLFSEARQEKAIEDEKLSKLLSKTISI